MKKFAVVLIIICAFSFVFAQNDGEILEFKSKIGFTSGEDKIIEHKFLENGKRLLIIGEKNLQVWDVDNAKLLNSVPHQIPQFAPRGFVSTYLLLSIPRILNWRPFLVDEGGRWIITVEKTGANPLRSAVVRDLQNLKQIAVMDLPNVSTEYVSFDENKNEIMTFGVTDKTGAFASWDKDRFTAREVVSIREYKWHQKIRSDEKMIVGSGDTKVVWSALGLNGKQGDTLTLRDVKSGAVEKEYAAKNLKPETAYQETTVSADEKFLISKRDDRVFVWEIDGGGQPKFEISNPNPKGSFSFKGIFERKYIVVKIDEQLRVYDIGGSGAPRLEVLRQNPKEDIDFVQIISDRFVIVEVDSKLRVYDMRADNTPILEIVSDNPKDTVEFQGVTEDGKYIVVRDDRKVSVFEVSGGGKPVYEIVRQSEKERFPAVKFLNDRNLLMVARVNRAEKKEPKTEFYDIATGRLVFDAAFEAGYDLKFTPDGKYLYETELGAFSVWNVAARRFYALGLETYTPSSNYDPNSYNYYVTDTPTNTEYTAFSPDYRYILRYDGDVTAVFETETGKLLQTIFNPEKVKYDKHNRIKKSGLGKAGWINNGRKYVYAFDSSNIFGSKTVSFWEVKK
ncbi:MAG TPA: WD40 repeat domain-containing protein [Pyrinomonadaceae bacterium]|nr:WD40 repeat domain-containing protein [Pyrinomonadaceae bacterium]